MIEMIAVSAKCFLGGAFWLSEQYSRSKVPQSSIFFKSECYVLSFAKITSKLNVDTK